MENYKLYIHKFPNGKVYVGITSQDVDERWRHGEGYKNQLVYRAILKYGWDAISHQVLLSGMTKEEAEEKEIEFISAFKSNNPEYGYNVSNGGNCYGTHSEETKRKIAKANTGRVCSEETREKIRKGNKGKKISKEQREKISQALKGRVFTQEHRDKIGASHKGRTLSEEARKKLSAAKMGHKFYCNNPEARGEKISNAMKSRNAERPEIMDKMRSASLKDAVKLFCKRPLTAKKWRFGHLPQRSKEFLVLTTCKYRGLAEKMEKLFAVIFGVLYDKSKTEKNTCISVHKV